MNICENLKDILDETVTTYIAQDDSGKEIEYKITKGQLQQEVYKAYIKTFQPISKGMESEMGRQVKEAQGLSTKENFTSNFYATPASTIFQHAVDRVCSTPFFDSNKLNWNFNFPELGYENLDINDVKEYLAIKINNSIKENHLLEKSRLFAKSLMGFGSAVMYESDIDNMLHVPLTPSIAFKHKNGIVDRGFWEETFTCDYYYKRLFKTLKYDDNEKYKTVQMILLSKYAEENIDSKIDNKPNKISNLFKRKKENEGLRLFALEAMNDGYNIDASKLSLVSNDIFTSSVDNNESLQTVEMLPLVERMRFIEVKKKEALTLGGLFKIFTNASPEDLSKTIVTSDKDVRDLPQATSIQANVQPFYTILQNEFSLLYQRISNAFGLSLNVGNNVRESLFSPLPKSSFLSMFSDLFISGLIYPFLKKKLLKEINDYKDKDNLLAGEKYKNDNVEGLVNDMNIIVQSIDTEIALQEVQAQIQSSLSVIKNARESGVNQRSIISMIKKLTGLDITLDDFTQEQQANITTQAIRGQQEQQQ